MDHPTTDPAFLPTWQEALPTQEERALLEAKLWTLLKKQVRLQTQGDHTSLREEDAAELLRSLLFSLQVALRRDGQPMSALLTTDLGALLKQAQRILQTELHTAGTLYAIALRSVNTFGSLSLADTLAGLGEFFKRYDFRLHAQDIPASIDYPLCRPVPETLQGVLYIREYLERLLTENKLLTCFEPQCVEALLHRASPDYRGLLQNLYEPVAANATGLALLGADVTPLAVTRAQAAQIYRELSVLPEVDAKAKLTGAARAACGALTLSGESSAAYLAETAETLVPRIVLSEQSAAGVFCAAG